MKLSSYEKLRTPNFHAHALRDILDDEGLDWRTALARVDIDPDALDRPGGTLPAKKDLAFQVEFASLTRERADIWVRAAKTYNLASFGVRGLALATAPTVSAWVEAACATDYAPSVLDIRAIRDGDGTVTGIEFTYPETPPELVPFSVYRDVFFIPSTFAWLYGSRFPFTLIEIPLESVSSALIEAVECPLVYEAQSLTFRWAPRTAVTSLPFGDAFQHEAWLRTDHRILESLRVTGDWRETVVRAIRLAPEQNRKLSNAAAALKVSPRTLQRKLAHAGVEFADLRDETLGDLASDLLSQTDQSISQISRALGYADPASFTSAFKRWKGLPPTAFRDGTRYDRNVLIGSTTHLRREPRPL